MIMTKSILTAAALTFGLALGTTSYANWSHKDASSSSMDRSSTSYSADARDFGQVAASVDNLKGMRVQDRAGEDLGTVRDVLFDSQTGKIDYLILASGISGAEKRYAIPFDSVRFRRDENLLTLNMDRDRLYSYAEPEHQYYGVSPSTREDHARRDNTAVVPEATAKTSLENLRGMRVEDRAGHEFGTVKDVAFDPTSGMISHMVITSNNRDFLVPIRDILYKPDRNEFSLNTDIARLSTVSPEFYGVAPATTYYKDSGLKLENENSGLTYENRTGQPPDRWEYGSSNEGRNFPVPEGYYTQGPFNESQMPY